MASAVVYENVAKDANLEIGKLFEGKKFWVAQRVPHRTALLNLIKANGGSIAQLEKQADWMIADHFRKDCSPGTISYDFIHKSIAKGEILDPSDFPAGPRIGTARDVGSIVRPAKGTRAPYTPEEDRILYKWAKNAQASGVAVSGNELYKKLEEKYPRHTWQSWRDRYLKKLQYMPPSAFDIPDNAPPSPPSDHSSRVAEPAVAAKTSLVKNKDKAWIASAEAQPTSMGKAASKEQATAKDPATDNKQEAGRPKYTVDQLAATFTTEDWENLYAFVEDIDGCSKEDESYNAAWTNWAESRDNQTAEQWRQYYEKVVRPQWLQDPVSKREQIKKKVEERLQDNSFSPVKSQSWSQTQDGAAVATHGGDPASKNPPQPTVSNLLPSDSRLASGSTAQQETPRNTRDGYESALKRIRGNVDDVPEPNDTPRPAKIRRGMSPLPTLDDPEGAIDAVGTQEHPLEVPSAIEPQEGSPERRQPGRQPQGYEQAAQAAEEVEEDVASAMSAEDAEHIAPNPRPSIVTKDEDDLESIASSTDFAHIAPLPRPPQIPEDDGEDDLPPNTPTPRAHRYAAFDTQAILSPSQAPDRITKLPRPPLDSSPPHHPESDASTTQSLQEFSTYLQETNRDIQTQPQQLLSRLPRPASPTPSSTSSTGSEDPDEPLAADEMDSFFASQHAAGFSSAFITAALKRTRCRPGLATAVLEAWRRGEALPIRRGVWSIEDDEMVESGDGAALARLERRHTLDGWGGITERMNFLAAWSRR